MKLRSLAINQFKKFSEPTLIDGIGDGLNVLVGPNEIGKSTLLDALRAALFEKHSSKAQSITALQNDRNHAAPVVDLTFEMEDGLYKITKRFLKKPYARLLCPDGRTLEGEAAEDALRTLLGFEEPGKSGARPEVLGMWSVLWVQQGQSFGAPEIPGSARSSLHRALETEVGTVLGGRRGREIPRVIEDQLGVFLTKNKGTPRGKYKEAIDRLKTLQEELELLNDRRQALNKDLEDLFSKEEMLSRLSTPEKDKADQEELAKSRKTYIRLSQLETEIKSAQTELQLRERKLLEATTNLEGRKILEKELASEEATLLEARTQLAHAGNEDKFAREELERIRLKVRDAEVAVKEIDDAVSRAQRVLSAIDLESRIQDLTGRWKKAKDAEERQSAARQKASAISVSDPSIMAIREAVKEVDKLSAQLKASATLIFFDLNPGAHENVSVNDHFLDQEKTSVQVYEVTTILIPERGKITVDPAARDQDKLLQKLKVAKAELKKHLIGVGVATSDEAEEQYLLRKKLLQDAEMARQETELHAPATGEIEAGAQALFDHIQGLATNLEREKEVLGLEKLPTRVEAESILDFTKAQAEKHRESLQLIQDSIRDQQAKVDQLTIGLAKALAGHEEAEKRLKKLQLQLKRLEAESASKALVEAIKIAKTDVLAQEKIISDLEGQRTGETLPLLETRIKRLENTIQERGDKRSNLKAEIAGLKAKIMMAEGEGLDETIARKNREVALGEEDVRRLEREVKILTLLLATLREAEQQAKERYLSPVLKRVRPYLQILFPNSDIILDHNLHITGVMRERSYEEAFEHLSMGTQEQIAVLIRLAFAEMLVDQGQPATVVLDDSLVFSDDHRIRRMFDILNHASRKVQVLVLTCREQLFEELGGRTLSLKPGNADDLLSA